MNQGRHCVGFKLVKIMAIEKIVVVDDEMMIRKALETQLRNKRYSVASTGDLKGARKILSRDSFDLVFLDFDCLMVKEQTYLRKSCQDRSRWW